MAANKRTKHEISRDRVLIARLYLRGHPQAEIAERIGVTQQQISYDLKQIQKKWAEASIGTYDELISKQLERVDALEIEAWRAWDLSLEDTEDVVRTAVPDAEGEPSMTGMTLQTRQGKGDPRWWDRIKECIEMRSKLLGLDVMRVALTDPTGQQSAHHLDDAVRAERIALMLNMLQERRQADQDQDENTCG